MMLGRAGDDARAHAEILERYGSIDGYLMDGLGCSQDDLEQLRNELLE